MNSIQRLVLLGLFTFTQTPSAQAADAYCRTIVWAENHVGQKIVAEVPARPLTEFAHGDLKIYYVLAYPTNRSEPFEIRAKVTNALGEKSAVAEGSLQGANSLGLTLSMESEPRTNTCFGQIRDVVIKCTSPKNKSRVDASLDPLLRDPAFQHQLPDCD